MTLNFKHLTPGYCGTQKKQMTLNATFYGELFSNQQLLKTKIIFPQRVLSPDFLPELINGETEEGKKSLKNQIKLITDKLKNLSVCDEQEVINWNHIAFRYGLWNEIVNRSAINIDDPNLMVESQFIKIASQSQCALFSNQAINPKIWEELFLTLKKNNTITPLIKAHIATAIIVMACRFGCAIENKTLNEAQQEILTIIEDTKETHYDELLRFSFAYRGMAMLPFLDKNTSSQYLKNAELLGLKAIDISSGIMQTVTAKENSYTCNQTLTKWYFTNKLKKSAFKSLDDMIALDPFDAIGYAETGFLYFKCSNYKKAEYFFEKAITLGPPSIGMHLFFRGLSLEELGKVLDAEKCFLQAIEADPTAISPYLSLLKLYKKSKHKIKREEITTTICNQKTLLSQLTEQEKKEFLG